MRIVFDAYELIPGQGKSIGIYNYAKNLLPALAEIIDEQTEILVICNVLNQKDFSFRHPAIKSVLISEAVPNKYGRLLWNYGRAAIKVRQFQADVYFSPKGFLPKGLKWLSPKAKSVVVIHDLIPLWYAENYPGYFGWLEEHFINGAIRFSAKFSDKVIAISQATATDISRRLSRAHDVRVVHNGLVVTEAGPRPIAEPYIFGMASRLPHKNADGLLAAYRIYRETHEYPLPMVICGLSDVEQDGVATVKGLDDTTLHAYYANAELFVFMSLIEGFGYPPIEALAHGTAVICSDIPALREVAKDYVGYVPPTEPELVAKGIAEAVLQKNTALLKRQRQAIVHDYSWRSCAEGVLAVIKS